MYGSVQSTRRHSSVMIGIHTHNDCGLADNVSATARYDGRTTRNVQISNDTVCTGTDGHNVVADVHAVLRHDLHDGRNGSHMSFGASA